jgi:hypothetical protein
MIRCSSAGRRIATTRSKQLPRPDALPAVPPFRSFPNPHARSCRDRERSRAIVGLLPVRLLAELTPPFFFPGQPRALLRGLQLADLLVDPQQLPTELPKRWYRRPLAALSPSWPARRTFSVMVLPIPLACQPIVGTGIVGPMAITLDFHNDHLYPYWNQTACPAAGRFAIGRPCGAPPGRSENWAYIYLLVL